MVVILNKPSFLFIFFFPKALRRAGGLSSKETSSFSFLLISILSLFVVD